VDALALPVDRVRLGVGLGGARELAVLERGIEELRSGCAAPVLVGALGPRARALAARTADGILFNWLTPAAAAEATATLRADAEGRPVEGVLYVRAITTAGARDALAAEGARYAGVRQYAANFARLGIDPLDTTLDLSADAPPALAAF